MKHDYQDINLMAPRGPAIFFNYILPSILAAIGIIMVTYFAIAIPYITIESMKAENDMLTNQRTALTAQMAAFDPVFAELAELRVLRANIEGFNNAIPQVSEIWNRLVAIKPAGVVISGLNISAGVVTFSAQAQTVEQVDTLIARARLDQRFRTVSVGSVTITEDPEIGRTVAFAVNMDLSGSLTGEPGEEEGGAK